MYTHDLGLDHVLYYQGRPPCACARHTTQQGPGQTTLTSHLSSPHDDLARRLPPHTRLHHDCIQMGPLAHISSCRRPVWDGWALQSRPAPSLALHPSSHCSHPWAVAPPSRWPAGNGWAHRSGPFADPTPVQANSSAPSCTPITHTSSCRRPVGNGWAYQTGPLMADSTHPR